MRYVVTGACGNLARQLITELLAAGGSVLAIDVRPPDTDEVAFRQIDLVDTKAMEKAITEFAPSVVLHMASMLSNSSEATPLQAWKVNADASISLLDICSRAGVKRFFYPSTGATYGGALPDSLPEDFEQWPQNIYGATKVAVERAGNYWAERHGLDFRSLRLPMVISPFAPSAAVSAYASHAFGAAKSNSGKSFVFPVTPDVGISTIYVRDVIAGVFALLDADAACLTRRVYNVHGFSATAGEIAAEIASLIPSFRYEFRPDPAVMQVLGALPSVHEDRSARADWRWNPQFGLSETVRDMLARSIVEDS